MAITFPRDMPEKNGRIVFEKAQFIPSYMQSSAPTRGSRPQVVGLAPDVWVMDYATPTLDYWEGMDFLAWLYTLQGGLRPFKARHPLYTYPQNYRNGWAGLTKASGGSFTGSCTLSAINAQRDTVTLTGLPVGFKVATHDLLSFPMATSQGTSQVLLAAVASATANSSGEMDMMVAPMVPFAAVANVTATFEKPWCLAIVDAKSIRGPMKPGCCEPITFTATQTY